MAAHSELREATRIRSVGAQVLRSDAMKFFSRTPQTVAQLVERLIAIGTGLPVTRPRVR